VGSITFGLTVRFNRALTAKERLVTRRRGLRPELIEAAPDLLNQNKLLSEGIC